MSAYNPDAGELAALRKLWLMAQYCNGGARVCARLLLGLYNGRRFPFDLTDLRLLDEEHLDAAITVLRMDARPAMEVHELLGRHLGTRGMGARFELMACDWGFKGRCTKQQEREQRAWLADLETKTPTSGTPREQRVLRAVP
jgi:hypothetical protein